MLQQRSLNDLYQELDQEFHPVIDYLVGLQVADRLSDSITTYDVVKLSQSYVVSIKKDKKSELNFHIKPLLKRVDIESFNTILPADFNYKVRDTGLNIDERFTSYDYRSQYFYLSFLEILSYEDILKLKQVSDDII